MDGTAGITPAAEPSTTAAQSHSGYLTKSGAVTGASGATAGVDKQQATDAPALDESGAVMNCHIPGSGQSVSSQKAVVNGPASASHSFIIQTSLSAQNTSTSSGNSSQPSVKTVPTVALVRPPMQISANESQSADGPNTASSESGSVSCKTEPTKTITQTGAQVLASGVLTTATMRSPTVLQNLRTSLSSTVGANPPGGIRTIAPQVLAPRLTQPHQNATGIQNIQLPPGMVLVRSESGQLLMIHQQALAQMQAQAQSQSAITPRPISMLDKTGDQQQESRLCSDCGCSFSPSHLDSHSDSASAKQKQTDNTDTPFKCPSCEAGGSSSPFNGRRGHRRIRLDPHSCSVCNKTFISSAHLSLHLTSHNKERKFRCNTCGKFFHQASHLMAHKSFRFMSNLLSHKAQEASGQAKPAFVPAPVPAPAPPVSQPQRAQSNMVDLKCGVCCRTFVRSSYIRLHIRLKKGQRPYHCKVCNKTFVKLETFVNHCDKHLRQKQEKNGVKYEVVKPPLFVPLSRPPSPESVPAQELSLEMNMRSKIKTE
ncbi:hypothetical protein GOODEAATRI_011642 [Goodea atripinnis]|uniref:C2H2-type domain-containing protein n=1 Tax=Goodea atripinnis TaxID=208336 RepID=A0ABV0N9U8_9TELE